MSDSAEAKVNIGTANAPVFIEAALYRLLTDDPDHVFLGIASGSTIVTETQLEAMLKFKPTIPSHA